MVLKNRERERGRVQVKLRGDWLAPAERGLLT